MLGINFFEFIAKAKIGESKSKSYIAMIYEPCTLGWIEKTFFHFFFSWVQKKKLPLDLKRISKK